MSEVICPLRTEKQLLLAGLGLLLNAVCLDHYLRLMLVPPLVHFVCIRSCLSLHGGKICLIIITNHLLWLLRLLLCLLSSLNGGGIAIQILIGPVNHSLARHSCRCASIRHHHGQLLLLLLLIHLHLVSAHLLAEDSGRVKILKGSGSISWLLLLDCHSGVLVLKSIINGITWGCSSGDCGRLGEFLSDIKVRCFLHGSHLLTKLIGICQGSSSILLGLGLA